MGVVVATLTNVRLLDVRGTDGRTDGHYSDVSSIQQTEAHPY